MNLILVFPLYAAVTDAESAHLGKIRVQKYKFFLINEDSHNYFLILHASKAGQPVKGRVFSILFCLLTAVFGLSARNIPSPADSLLAEGDRLHRLYRFEEALDCYGRALRDADDPAMRVVLEQRYQHSQNALNMTDICEDVTVVARRRFARKDFFLYYPLKNQSWRSAPNVLDPSGSGEVPTYAPKGSREVFFSASDASGARNLYVTRDLDSLWSVPRLLGEGLLSSGNEIFPMRSPDGKTLPASRSKLLSVAFLMASVLPELIVKARVEGPLSVFPLPLMVIFLLPLIVIAEVKLMSLVSLTSLPASSALCNCAKVDTSVCAHAPTDAISMRTKIE